VCVCVRVRVRVWCFPGAGRRERLNGSDSGSGFPGTQCNLILGEGNSPVFCWAEEVSWTPLLTSPGPVCFSLLLSLGDAQDQGPVSSIRSELQPPPIKCVHGSTILAQVICHMLLNFFVLSCLFYVCPSLRIIISFCHKPIWFKFEFLDK
jgi:hypothetical protein